MSLAGGRDTGSEGDTLHSRQDTGHEAADSGGLPKMLGSRRGRLGEL